MCKIIRSYRLDSQTIVTMSVHAKAGENESIFILVISPETNRKAIVPSRLQVHATN
jgi:hypothetical protein